MKYKIFIGVISVEKNSLPEVVETVVCRAAGVDEAREIVVNHAHSFIEANKIETGKAYLFIQEKNAQKFQKLVSGANSPYNHTIPIYPTAKEFFANIVRTKIRAALDQKADCVSDDFVN